MRVMRSPALGLLRVFAFGAVVGAFFDGFHTYGGATSYPDPIALRMAWWTPPLFGAAFTLLSLTYAAARRSDEDPPPGARRAAGFAAFGALYFASGFLPAGNGAKLAVLLVGAAVLFAFVDRSRAAIVAGVISAIAGPAFEIVLSRLGAFSHLQPDAMGIPVWLPGLYFASGPGLGPFVYALLTRPRSPVAA